MNYEHPHSHRAGEAGDIGTPEMRKQIGRELRNAREVQNLSLEQIVATTKINIRYLQQIEVGNWNFLPPLYAKAFILAYADAVHLESDKLVRQVQEIFPSTVIPDHHEAWDAALKKPVTQSPTVQALWTWLGHNRSWLLYGAVGIVFVVLVTLYITSPTGAPNLPEETLPQPRRGEALQPSPPSPAPNPTSVTKPAPSRFELEVSASDTCYVKVETEDSVLYERTLWPGNRTSLTLAGSAKVSLGNAPAARVVVNGITQPSFPETRRVRVFRVNVDGIVPE